MESSATPTARPPRLAVLGVGLIGGSIGLAARRRLGAEVVGYDPDPANLERALAIGAIDRAAGSVPAATEGAEAIFCAAPVAALPGLVVEALAASSSTAVVSDVGSTKRTLVEALAGLDGSDRFIGGHPLAGAETAGVDGSREDLFEGARWYLTPTERSQGVLFDRLHRVLAGIGARPQAIDAETHDREMAAISHLPHVLANALVAPPPARSGPIQTVRPRSGGASATPPASPAPTRRSGPTSSARTRRRWRRRSMPSSRSSRRLRADPPRGPGRAAGLAAGRPRGSPPMLEADLTSAPLLELRVAVENRPGTVAEIALALGRAGVNIEDMSLFPAADQRTGAISLWIAGLEEARRAAEIVAGLGHTVAPISEAG